MSEQLELVRAREEEVRKLLERLSEGTRGFEDPRPVLVGGYALRAFVPFYRTTGDCDFVVGKGDPWHLDVIKRRLPKGLSIASEEKRDDYAFLRCLKLLRIDRQEARISLDFMEGKVISRTTNRELLINAAFLDGCTRASVRIGSGTVRVCVPLYADYLLLKIASGRPGDVRDIAALVWKIGVPADLERRAARFIPDPDAVRTLLADFIIPVVEDGRFVHSWRGMFVTTDFTEETKREVLGQLRRLIR